MTTTPQTSSAPLGKVEVEMQNILKELEWYSGESYCLSRFQNHTLRAYIRTLEAKLEASEAQNAKMRNAVEDDWRDKETVIGIVRNVLIAKVYSQDGYVIGIPIDQDVRDVARKEAIAHAIKIFSSLPQS